MKWGYLEAVKADIKTYMDENQEWFYGMYADGKIDRDEWVEKMEDELWAEDSVTGNGSGSYTMNREEAKLNVRADFGTVCEALEYYDCSKEEIGIKFVEEDWEWFDVVARLYCLSSALYQIARELDDNNFDINGESYFAEEG